MNKVIAAKSFLLLPTDRDAFSIVMKMFYPSAVRDRFGVLNRLSPINWTDQTDELPVPYEEQVALGSIMDEHMMEILSKYSEGNIVITWSGGVDSTALICAYLRSGADISRLIIVCTTDSIEEYPFFYELLKKQGANVRVVENVTDELSEVDCSVILTGWCADQLFGSDVNTRDITLYNKPWVEALITYARNEYKTNFTKKSLDIIERVYTDYATKLGLKVEEWCEFLWMMNFGCKWTYVQNVTNLSLARTKNYGKAVPFYEDMKFQRWAMTRFSTLRDRNPHINAIDYKKPLKQYILNYTSDLKYFKTKGKMATRTFQRSEIEYVHVLTEDGVKTYSAVENRGCTGCVFQAVANKFRKDVTE